MKYLANLLGALCFALSPCLAYSGQGMGPGPGVGISAAATTFATDNFTGIALNTTLVAYSQAANCAGASTSCWVAVTGQGGATLSGTGSNSIYENDGASQPWQVYAWTFTQATTADYYVQATIAAASTGWNSFGPCVRIQSTASDAASNAYCVNWNNSGWYVQYRKGGSTSTPTTDCSSTNGYTGSDPTTPRTIKIAASGSTPNPVVVTVTIAGTLRITCSDNSSPIYGKGFAGIVSNHTDISTGNNFTAFIGSN